MTPEDARRQMVADFVAFRAGEAVTTYRGWQISEVCGVPFAYQGEGDNRHTINPPPYTGLPGLVDAIDAHMRVDSIAACQAILAAARTLTVA